MDHQHMPRKDGASRKRRSCVRVEQPSENSAPLFDFQGNATPAQQTCGGAVCFTKCTAAGKTPPVSRFPAKLRLRNAGGRPPRRRWLWLLRDAKERDISVSVFSTEINVPRHEINKQMRRYGIRLRAHDVPPNRHNYKQHPTKWPTAYLQRQYAVLVAEKGKRNAFDILAVRTGLTPGAIQTRFYRARVGRLSGKTRKPMNAISPAHCPSTPRDTEEST